MGIKGITGPYKGDTFEINCDADTNITGWKIRAELWDDSANSKKKATANSGGSNDQIEITDAANGLFTIKFDKGDTTAFDNNSYLEIELETSDGKIYTGYRDAVIFLPEKITWTTPT
ncbi:MAG: hypothetical protein HY350_02320 [Candidatus Omnitrophica bacterium]|nr:hypothetical protein [Candidatus Omnitrophota bacterium]